MTALFRTPSFFLLWFEFGQDLGRHGDGNTHVGQALRDGWRCLVLMKDVVDVDG